MRNLDIWSKQRDAATVQQNGMKVLATESNGAFFLQMWKPKAIKPLVNYRFKDKDYRDKYAADILKRYDDQLAAKAKRRLDRAGTAADFDKIQIGDIFYYSWGYDQTNVEFFQVVAKFGKMVSIMELNQESFSNDGGSSMSDYRMPIKNSFVNGAKLVNKKVQFSNGVPYMSADFGSFSLWDGKKKYCSWYA